MLTYYRALASGDNLSTKPISQRLEETAAYRAMVIENQSRARVAGVMSAWSAPRCPSGEK
jgi:hypothetical protein